MPAAVATYSTVFTPSSAPPSELFSGVAIGASTAADTVALMEVSSLTSSSLASSFSWSVSLRSDLTSVGEVAITTDVEDGLAVLSAAAAAADEDVGDDALGARDDDELEEAEGNKFFRILDESE